MMRGKKNLSHFFRLAIPLLFILAPISICGNYINFRVKIRNLIPQYDATNEAIFSEINPPDGVTEKEMYSVGISNSPNTFGRNLTVYYRYDPDITNSDDLASYYEQILLSSGWDEHYSDESYWVFVREKSCVSLLFLSNTYRLDIWQDFVSQKITPPLPIGLEIFNLFEADVLTCP